MHGGGGEREKKGKKGREGIKEQGRERKEMKTLEPKNHRKKFLKRITEWAYANSDTTKNRKEELWN